MEFNEFKELIISRAKQADACQSEYKKALSAQTKEELLSVIAENASWCYSAKVIDIPTLNFYRSEELWAVGIYINYTGSVKGKCLVIGGKVEARENSSVVARENSSVVARENSSVVAWGNSSVVAWGNSSVVAWGNSNTNCYNSADLHKVNDRATIKELQTGKIYFKKDAFTIVEL